MATFNGDGAPNIFTGGADADTGYGNGGDDQLSGNGGNDILYGNAGADTLDGGANDDILVSYDVANLVYAYFSTVSLDVGTEHDILIGGDGDDLLVAGYGDDVSGGAGYNKAFINFLGATSGVYADFRAQWSGGSIVVGGGTISGVTQTMDIQGSNYDDTLYPVGSYYGFSTVHGNGGNDYILADYYNFYLYGDDGNDTLDARMSGYTHDVDGGSGDDIIYTPTNSFSSAHGGDGNDTIYSHGVTYGGAGNDTIVLQQSYYIGPVYGEAGDDDISAAAYYSYVISGGSGADVLRGNTGDDKLVSGDFKPDSPYQAATYTPAADMGLEQDRLTGAEGNDTLAIGYGDDADGGVGNDTLWLSLGGLAQGATFDTAGIVTGQPFVLGGGTIQNIETLAYLRGTDFDDHLTIATQASLLTVEAGDGGDVIVSNASSIALYAGAGNDHFFTGIAGDHYDGGAGFDMVYYTTAAAGVTVVLAAPGQLGSGGGGDSLVDVEGAGGSAFDDSLTGNDLANRLTGEAGNDTLTGQAGNDTLDGGLGADILRGGAGDDNYYVDDAGDVVEENAGEGTDLIFTRLATHSLVALPNVENLFALNDIAHDFRGNSGNNSLTGGRGNDIFRLQDGGDDTVFGGIGDDAIFFIGALTGADLVNGSDGTDTLVLQGPYGALTLTGNITQIENISLLAGSNTNFGEPGTNRYDYVLTTNDANFAAGVQARINGAALLAGEDFTFNGSAETNANFVVYGGKGVDTLTGGLGNDIFYYPEERFASGDTVNGGPGYDGMFLRGNYTIDFNAPGYTGLFTNIENLTLTSATDERYARGGGTEFDYNLTLSNAIVKPGETLTVSGALLMATETMILDASQEADGLLRLFGGRADDTLKGGANADLIHGNLGADQLTGNGGADSFRYQSVEESNSATMDEISDFTPGSDSIDLSRVDASSGAAGDQAFSWIGSSAFSGSAGELRAYENNGSWFVEGDTNGDGVADLVIALTLQGPTPLGTGDFLL
ncbi:MAG TPA: calcium-binding protein [Allosphingosinicella sp.]|nr:calcium-binding protein [Allosphingosinicella sp.]